MEFFFSSSSGPVQLLGTVSKPVVGLVGLSSDKWLSVLGGHGFSVVVGWLGRLVLQALRQFFLPSSFTDKIRVPIFLRSWEALTIGDEHRRQDLDQNLLRQKPSTDGKVAKLKILTHT